MIEAAKIWNEPNNKSHWDLELDPGWTRFAEMAVLAAKAIREVHPTLTRVLGGISPIDPGFMHRMKSAGVLDHVDAVAVHGFPLDWNLWQIDEWPNKIAEIESLVSVPVWVTEIGVSSFGAEEVQAWGIKRSAQLLKNRSPRIHWYSLYDLPAAWRRPPATRRRMARPTTGIFIWVCCVKTAHPNSAFLHLPKKSMSSACANGSILRITGSTTRSPGCDGSVCATFVPACPGRTVIALTRWPGSIVKWRRSPSSM